MPNNPRSNRKREVERAIGNVEWSKTHIMRILDDFIDTSIAIVDNGNDITDEYVNIMDIIRSAIQGMELVIEILKKVDEMI